MLLNSECFSMCKLGPKASCSSCRACRSRIESTQAISSGGPCTEIQSTAYIGSTFPQMQNGVMSPPINSTTFGFDWTNYFVTQTPFVGSYTEAVSSHLTSPVKKDLSGNEKTMSEEQQDTPATNLVRPGQEDNTIDEASILDNHDKKKKYSSRKKIKNCKVEIRKSFSDPDMSNGENGKDSKKAKPPSTNGLHPVAESEAEVVEKSVEKHPEVVHCSSSLPDLISYKTKNHTREVQIDGNGVDVDSATREYTTQRLKMVASSAAAVVITCDRNKKKVTFADDLGKTLASIKVIYDTSDTPPLLGLTAFKDLNIRSSDKNEEATEFPESKFTCSFMQPSSQYIMFRELIEKNNISLNNLCIDTYAVSGSVTVKNLHFEKKVSLRVTFDNWVNHQDFHSVWTHSDHKTDTFSFAFDIPSDQESPVEICLFVSYPKLQQDFWDNNRGQNYVLAPVKKKPQPYNRQFKPNFTNVKHFADFSVFEHYDDEIYY